MAFSSQTISVCLETYGCCALEVENIFSSVYDHLRPWTLIPDVPDKSEILIVSGWLNLAMQAHIKSVYAKLKGSRKVIALGACQISGSVYQIKQARALSIDQILPVSVFVSGCPPSPEQIISGIELALKIDISKTPHSSLKSQDLLAKWV